jgi:hypothetical protein
MRLGEKIYNMYYNNGCRVDHIATVLCIKQRSVSSLLSRERRAKGHAPLSKNNFPTTKPTRRKSSLISFAGADE